MSLKEVKQRILSVKNTQKITSAMKLISAAKLRRAQNVIENARPYEQKLNAMLRTFLSGMQNNSIPYMRDNDEIKNAVLIPVSSNSSLCGSFNAAIIRETKETLAKYSYIDNGSIEILPVGKKIFDALNKTAYNLNPKLMSQAVAPCYSDVAKVAYELMQRFLDGEIDSVELIYTHFHSPAKQIVVREKFLPMSVDMVEIAGEETSSTYDFILEPDKETLLQKLLPKAMAMRLYTALLDSVAAEHAARMLAMQIATDNADELITTLVREYNKSRQQAITNELLDIVAGSMN